jgi:hypothetical protein
MSKNEKALLIIMIVLAVLCLAFYKANSSPIKLYIGNLDRGDGIKAFRGSDDAAHFTGGLATTIVLSKFTTKKKALACGIVGAFAKELLLDSWTWKYHNENSWTHYGTDPQGGDPLVDGLVGAAGAVAGYYLLIGWEKLF